MVSGLISAGSCCCECPLILAQRLKQQQPAVSRCVITPNTCRPGNVFSLFREHQKDFKFNFLNQTVATDGRFTFGRAVQMVISVQRIHRRVILLSTLFFKFVISRIISTPLKNPTQHRRCEFYRFLTQ